MRLVYAVPVFFIFFFFSSRRRHTRLQGDWSSDVCSSDLCDRSRDFILHREYIGKLPVVTLRPQVESVGRTDQLGGDPDAVPAFADAPFEDVLDSQFVGDLRNLQVLSLEGECRGAGCHFESRDLCQSVDDLLGQSVTEVLLLFVAAHVGEGQHGDRWLPLRVWRPGLFQCRLQVGHALKPVRRAFGQALPDNLLKGGRGLKRRRIVAQHTTQHLRHRVSWERASSRDYLIQDRAEAEYVGSFVEWPSFGLLGRHISCGAENGSVCRLRGIGILGGHQLRQAKIKELDGHVVRQQNIGRLQIAVAESSSVRQLQSVRDLSSSAQYVGWRQRPCERPAFDVL